MMRRILNTCIVSVLCLGALTGCLERNERLTIRPDGSAFCEINYNSNSLDDIYGGDPVPSPADGWVVEEQHKQNSDGKDSYSLHGVLVVDQTTPLPSCYGTPIQEETGQALRFPTELTIEARLDGTYYHFRRVYESRRWAYVEIKKREIIDEPLKGIKDKDETELTDRERTQLIRGYAQFEVEKALVFAREAQLEVAPETPQDAWLEFAANVRLLPEEVDYATLIQIVNEENPRTRDTQLKAEVEKWEKELATRVERSARRLMEFGPGKLNRFLDVYGNKRNEFSVSEDLGDDVFKIEVDMPGQIVATNAKGHDDTSAHWEFSGEQLRDASLELMVTSVVR